MIDSKYIKLKTVGIEVHEDYLIFTSNQNKQVEIQLSRIKKIGLNETGELDHSGFLSYLFSTFNRFKGNHGNATPSKVYKLYILLKDKKLISKDIQNFDLIGVKRDLDRLDKQLR